MKKLFALAAVSAAVLGLASCGNKDEQKPDGPKTITLTYAGSKDKKEFNETLFEKFKEDRKAKGDLNKYVIKFADIGPDKIDSTVTDWKTGPDVFEYASDKVQTLYEKGALSKVVAKNAEFIDTTMTKIGKDLASFNGSYYGYPWSGDNTYYLQYDKSVVTEEQSKNIMTLLDALHANGKKLAYNLPEAFWGAGALFTFGADYKVTFNNDGGINNIDADFDSEKGVKAAKAILNIVNHPAWTKDDKDPKLAACIAGTWAINDFKTLFGDNYAANVMPEVTIDGETKNLGCFLGGKLFGVNPQKGDKEKLLAAHELAKFLAGDTCQEARFDDSKVGPCSVKVSALEKVKNDYNMEVLVRQQAFAHAQTAVPANIWTAPATLVTGMIDKTVTGDNLVEACKTLNENIKKAQN